MPPSDDTRIKASEIEYFLESGELPDRLTVTLERILLIFKEQGGANFILGKVIIENDFEIETEESTNDE